MRIRLIAAVAVAVGFGVLAGAHEEKEMTKVTVWPAGEIKWTEMSATIKGAQIAVLKGDPKTGGYEALKKLPAGTNLGWHTHTSGQEVLVISGTIELEVEGVGKKDLGPGSWTVLPGGTRHAAQCKAGADCVYFEDQPGASDYKPAEAPKK